MSETRKLKVFLCHSKDDKPKVRELYHRLVADDFDPWLDEEKLMPGQDWDLEIRKAVRESNVVIVCLSTGSITKSGYVQKEIRFALDVADEQPDGAIYLIPAKLEGCQVPSRLNKWQWVNLFEDNGYEKLKHSLNFRANNLGLQFFNTFSKEIRGLFFEPIMLNIPAGKFLMGSTKEQVERAINDGANSDWVKWEQPQHIVELSEYFIGKYPVTNNEYQAFVRDTKQESPYGWQRDQYPSGKSEHPVVNVSWNDAVAYCKWISDKSGKHYRLPTEAEWEKAARGGDGRAYPWGNDFDSKKANTSEASIGETSEVGKFSIQGGDSPYGCADMVGNVWEWCNDWFNEKEYKNRVNAIVKDPQGPENGTSRIMRGGSFINHPGRARCAYRGRLSPEFLRGTYGFRIAFSYSTAESNE